MICSQCTSMASHEAILAIHCHSSYMARSSTETTIKDKSTSSQATRDKLPKLRLYSTNGKKLGKERQKPQKKKMNRIVQMEIGNI